MTSEGWTARYPDLAGKVAVVAGESTALVAIAEALAANHAPVCVVSDDRGVVEAALAVAESSAGGAMGVAASPSDAATWRRVLPHAEQRLGPLDIVVAAGSPDLRAVVMAAVLPDMAARRRGVIIEVGQAVTPTDGTPGVRRRCVLLASGTAAADVGAAVALCASDVLSAADVTIQLD